MPLFRIRMINSDFESFEERDYRSLEAARQAAVVTAARIACESIAAGEPICAIELEIRDGDDLVARNVVTLSVADLSGARQAAEPA